ncbi:tetratricopeptide repeat protein [Fontisphaera persica]|uniref:tetratricopeptide repeat protein n=1 Tax=Fontisphaera persica TaxID=2974023 RepID=UPI0024BFFAF8|nr:tetratricopeptide repeat protein [Fontisphaera persica]WCJ60585.1 tetratricopeptide repeat protein [Fontisphaera persica]
MVTPLWGAASAAERRALNTAQILFNDGSYDLAERELAEFVRRYPNSSRLPEAVLLQAQARFKLKNLNGAIELLQNYFPQAGTLADEYRFWIAEARYEARQFGAAAADYAQLLRDFPKSRRRLEAIYGEALCRFQLQEWNRVKELLGQPDGDFQRLTAARLEDAQVVRAYLLLGETLWHTKEYRAGEVALLKLNADRLPPELAWEHHYLLCRLQMADQRLTNALATSLKLMQYARAGNIKQRLADTIALQAALYEQLQQWDAAVRVYESNLSEVASPTQRRQALLKVIELTLAQNQVAAALQKLEAFVANHPNDPAQDLAQFTLGELKLRLHVERVSAPAVPPASASETNLLQAALGHFNRVITDFPQSPYLPKALLLRGWCQWLEGSYVTSQSSFRQAAERLPAGPDQAVAQFKLGDTYLYQKDYSNALAQFQMVLSNYAGVAEIRGQLLDQALYQILRACIALGDLAGAESAFRKLVEWFPESYYSDRSMLLLGQALNRVNQPARAREVFAQLAQRFPDSPLALEARLAMARSYAQESRWEEALEHYNAWAADAAARRKVPAAEFDRAWVHFRAGRETNALELFSRFAQDFQEHPLAPRAVFWIANYYFRHNDLTNAETHYQRLFQTTNWPRSELTYQAQLMAGRAALARQSVRDATNYFLMLINDTNTPTPLLLSAYFAYGDTMVDLPVFGATNVYEQFANAITILSKIPQTDPTSPLVPAAWGRIGDCYFQLAAQDPKFYDSAAEYYQLAMTNTAEVSVRSQAEVGLGMVREKQAALQPAQREALLAEAFEHYRNVLYGRNLNEDETADPFWLRRAGLAAAALKENQREFAAAQAIYQRLKNLLPVLAEYCDRRIERLRELSATP